MNLRAPFLLLATLLLAGCSALPPRPPLVDYRASDEVLVTFSGDWGVVSPEYLLDAFQGRLEARLGERASELAEAGVRVPRFRLRCGSLERSCGGSPRAVERVAEVTFHAERDPGETQRFEDVDTSEHLLHTSTRRTRKVAFQTSLKVRCSLPQPGKSKPTLLEVIKSASLQAPDNRRLEEPIEPSVQEGVARASAAPREALLTWAAELLTYCQPDRDLSIQRPEGAFSSRSWLVREIIDGRTLKADQGYRQIELHLAEPGALNEKHVGCFVRFSFADRAQGQTPLTDRADELGL